MTWKVQDIVSQRKEFVMMALGPGSNIRELCRRFGISPRTGYKWIGRYNLFPEEGLKDRSRRPRSSPARTGAAVERRVLELRETRGWGGRKIRHRLRQLGLSDVPAASTISDILRRHEMIDPVESSKHRATQRFEHPPAQRPLADGFQGAFSHGQRPLPPTDGSRRPFALRHRFARMRQRKGRERRADLDAIVSPLRSSPAHADGQWPALGRQSRAPLDPLDGLAHAPGGGRFARAALPSADTGQGGAVSPNAQARVAWARVFRRSDRSAKTF